MTVTDVGSGALDKQVARHILDSGATRHLTPNADGFASYREYSRGPWPLQMAKQFPTPATVTS